MSRILLRAAVATALLAASACSRAPTRPGASGIESSKTAPHVVMVSIDGLRPEFYRGDRFATPELHALARDGASAARVEPVFPSLTYPNHASLLTGVRPARHGVVANHVFDAALGPREDLWYWFAKDVKAETLWQAVKQAGKSVAIIRWPSTTGARVDWLLPEIFFSPGIDLAHDFQRVLENADPVFLSEIMRARGDRWPETLGGLDELAIEAATAVLRAHHPDFMLVHLAEVDFVQHKTGRDSADTARAVADADARIGRLRQELASDPGAVMVVVGDHGFADYEDVVHVNQLFAERGWLVTDESKHVKRWSVMADGEGGQAAVYARDSKLAGEARRLVRKKLGDRCEIIERRELDALGANPAAAFVLLAARGTKFDSSHSAGELVTREGSIKGQHGYSVAWPEMGTGLLMAGNGVARGRDLGAISILDVAPTVASVLRVALPYAERPGLFQRLR